MKWVIEIADVRKRFGRVGVLNGVTFAVRPGQSVALWGSNGAGKTTLVRCLLGLTDFDGGIRVAGLDVRRHGKAARRFMGYVPQELALYDDFRVIEAAHFMARLRGRRATRARLASRNSAWPATPVSVSANSPAG